MLENPGPIEASKSGIEAKNTPKPNIDNSLKRCEEVRSALCKNPAEEQKFNETVEKNRLPEGVQKAVLNSLEKGTDPKLLNDFKGKSIVAVAERALKTTRGTPHSLDAEVKLGSAGINLEKAGRYLSYSKTPDGQTTVQLTIPMQDKDIEIGASKEGGRVKLENKTGDSTEVSYDAAAGSARIDFVKSGGTDEFTLSLNENASGKGTIQIEGGYGNDQNGTTIMARAGGLRGETPSAQLAASQRLAAGHVANVELKYENGEVTGTVAYTGPVATAMITIEGDRQLRYMATVNAPNIGGVAVSGGVEGSVDLENPTANTDVTGNLGASVDLGKGGNLKGGAFLRKGTGDNEGRQEWGGSIDYAVSF